MLQDKKRHEYKAFIIYVYRASQQFVQSAKYCLLTTSRASLGVVLYSYFTSQVYMLTSHATESTLQIDITTVRRNVLLHIIVYCVVLYRSILTIFTAMSLAVLVACGSPWRSIFTSSIRLLKYTHEGGGRSVLETEVCPQFEVIIYGVMKQYA